MVLTKSNKVVLALAGIWLAAFALHTGCDTSSSFDVVPGVGEAKQEVLIEALFAKAPMFVVPDSKSQRTNFIDVASQVPNDGDSVRFELPSDSVSVEIDSSSAGVGGDLDIDLVVAKGNGGSGRDGTLVSSLQFEIRDDGTVNVISSDSPRLGRDLVSMLGEGDVSIDVIVKGDFRGVVFVDGTKIRIGVGTGLGNSNGNDNTGGNGNGNDNTNPNGNDNTGDNGNDNTGDNGNDNTDPNGNDNTGGNGNDNTDPNGNDNTGGNGNDNTDPNGNDNTGDNGNDNTNPNGNDNTGDNGNDNTDPNGNDNTGDNGNDNTDPNGNDNTGGNGNDNTDPNGNDNTGGNGNDNTDPNGNDNTGDNGNDNTGGGTCSDGSTQLRVEVEGPGDFEVEARYSENGPDCRRFRLDIEGFVSGWYDVYVNDVFVGEIFADSDDGKGRLRLETDDGNFPAGFPDVAAGDVVSVGDVIDVTLQTHCSETFSCDNMNGNDNTGNDNTGNDNTGDNTNDNSAGNANDNGG